MTRETPISATVPKGSIPHLTVDPATIVDIPNKQTLDAFRELKSMRCDPAAKVYESEEELFACLGLQTY